MSIIVPRHIFAGINDDERGAGSELFSWIGFLSVSLHSNQWCLRLVGHVYLKIEKCNKKKKWKIIKCKKKNTRLILHSICMFFEPFCSSPSTLRYISHFIMIYHLYPVILDVQNYNAPTQSLLHHNFTIIDLYHKMMFIMNHCTGNNDIGGPFVHNIFK